MMHGQYTTYKVTRTHIKQGQVNALRCLARAVQMYTWSSARKQDGYTAVSFRDSSGEHRASDKDDDTAAKGDSYINIMTVISLPMAVMQ